MNLEIESRSPEKDGRVRNLSHLKTEGLFESLLITDIYRFDLPSFPAGAEKGLLYDPVAQRQRKPEEDRPAPSWNLLVEISYKPGVTNPEALTLKETLEGFLNSTIPEKTPVQTARRYRFSCTKPADNWIKRLVPKLYNPLIETAVVITAEQWNEGIRPPEYYPVPTLSDTAAALCFPVSTMGDKELLSLSKNRLLALSLEELRTISSYYSSPEVISTRRERGLSAGATEPELEMLAQSWSEHCKHKIFQARIIYEDEEGREEISSLFDKYIKGTTERIAEKKSFLRSVFYDNSGIIDFDGKNLLCFKAETHNSPSALDPYGGSITGIVGVNRDILGTGKGARPIFNTDVLCFAFPDTPAEDVPEGLIHPKRLLSGVHRGIVDGGNQSGIPVAAGAFHFDETYLGKPLVFCGTGGILPAEIGGEASWIKHIDPGDLAVMVGGRIGKDGIHGATFSSGTLDESSPVSAVQIGDPITQRKMADFLLEARDKGLYKGITDNGAGGLSSSLGEMARESGGIKIDLSACPLKYPGLTPWEILVSESQERMSLSVDPAKIGDLLTLAGKRDVEASVVGEFTDTGYIEAFYKNKLVLFLDLDFLHNGLPRMDLTARWKGVKKSGTPRFETGLSIREVFLRILEDPVVASKEQLVRQYDHEVQAQSVIKPFCGVLSDAPTDGAVLRPVYTSNKGITVTHGLCPRFGDYDTYSMAMAAVDEAYRSHIALGGDPDTVSALDNFCWPDPVPGPGNPDGEYKLAQLVRCCRGLSRACLAYGIPLISGKDSMKNDTIAGGRKISVRPTLLVSMMGIIPDVRKAVTADFKTPGDYVIVLGLTRGELGGTVFERLFAPKGGGFGCSPEVFPEEALPLYKALHEAIKAGLIRSAHDLSDGGLGVALFESALGGRLGARIEMEALPGYFSGETSERLLFCETQSRILVTVSSGFISPFSKLLGERPWGIIGKVTKEPELVVLRDGIKICGLLLSEGEERWKREW